MRNVSVRDLRNDTSQVVAAVRAGERVTLTVRGEPVADIVAHGGRSRWLSGAWLAGQLEGRQADPALTSVLAEALGDTIDEL